MEIYYPPGYLLFMLLSGFFWTMTYILTIRRGWLDKTFGMPIWALAMNISWEFIYSFITPLPRPQGYINIIWFTFDLIILYEFIKFWKADYSHIRPISFYPLFTLIMITAFGGVLFIQFDSIPLPDYPLGRGSFYSAWGMNVIMSILYVHFIIQRQSVQGQSLYIALCKMLGTLCPAIKNIIWAGAVPGVPEASSYLFPFMYLTIFVFDLTYTILIYRKTKSSGLSPWTRL